MLEAPLRLALSVGAISIVLELVALNLKSSTLRRISYASIIPLTAFSACLLITGDLRPVTGVIVLISVFRILNCLRVAEARMQEPQLYHASQRTSLWLIVFQVTSVAVWLTQFSLEISKDQVLHGIMAVSIAFALIAVFSVRRNLKKSAVRPSDKYTPDAELPSVSVCLPARNETEDLPSCLESILSSDYPKLEILVLDDCSQDRTSEIIKGYAQKGVRFIKGEEPNKGWLAKNQAYQSLAEAASGEIFIFCGVDTRFDKTAIRCLIASMMARKKQMISLLPKSSQKREHVGIIQPMRYWWELALPRRLFNRPPVLSTVWAINRQAFFAHGEIKAVKNSVLPEGYFARELTKSDEYSFMRASGKLMVSTAKKLPDQWQTAVRTRYPRLRKRLENVLLITLAELWFLALPVYLFVLGFFVNLGYLGILAGINVALLAYVHIRITNAWGATETILLLTLLPIAIAMEIVITLVSMWRYEFSDIKWKDRNICIPVMRHYKRLS